MTVPVNPALVAPSAAWSCCKPNQQLLLHGKKVQLADHIGHTVTVTG